MTKISNQDVYIIDTDVSDLDSIIGTDGNTTAKKTKNFLLGKLKQYFVSGLSPLEGGTLRYTEIIYNGELYATNADVLNNLDPVFVVEQYHVVVVNLNGVKSILKLQNQSVGIDLPDVLTTDFIEITPTASNLGATGARLFKELSNNDYKFRRIVATNSGGGATLLKTQEENAEFISIIAKTLIAESQGSGTSIIKDLQVNTNDNKLRLKSLISSSLNITATETDEVSIELPVVSDIPSLIVNSAYSGDEETGTASKPFKTIQAALDAYKGTGGRGTILDPANPELINSIIEIEKGSGAYNFTGDFNYKDLQITLKEGVRINSTPISGWLMDFNLFSTILSHKPILVFAENAYINCNTNGFKLIGVNLPSTGNSIFKMLTLRGVGGGVVLIGTTEADILFEVDGANLQYENSGYSTLEISSRVSINRGRMFVIKGKGQVDNKGNFLNILNNINDTITNTYPTVEIANSGNLSLSGSEFWIGATPTVTYTQFLHLTNSATFTAIDTIFRGNTEYFAYNNTAADTAGVVLDSCKMYILTDTSFGGIVSGVWGNINLTYNNMPNTSINPTTTTLIASSVNTIGGKIIETLSTYGSKALAVAAGIGKGGAFIKATNVNAVDLVAGVEYKVTTFGDGALGALNTYFTATGSETGTGVGTLYERDIVM